MERIIHRAISLESNSLYQFHTGQTYGCELWSHHWAQVPFQARTWKTLMVYETDFWHRRSHWPIPTTVVHTGQTWAIVCTFFPRNADEKCHDMLSDLPVAAEPLKLQCQLTKSEGRAFYIRLRWPRVLPHLIEWRMRSRSVHTFRDAGRRFLQCDGMNLSSNLFPRSIRTKSSFVSKDRS